MDFLATRNQRFAMLFTALTCCTMLADSVVQAAPVDSADAGQSIQAVLTVGSGAGCTYSNLQTAINAASNNDTIRVARGAVHLGRTYQITGKSLSILGGFSSCDLSETPSDRTTLDANGASARVFEIYQGVSPPAVMKVQLENLSIKGGNGGIRITGQPGRLAVALKNTEVTDNSASNVEGGGGIMVSSSGVRHTGTPDPILTLDNQSALLNNTASGNGGGLACVSDGADTSASTFIRIGTSLIYGNSALNGGGISTFNCRRVIISSGAPTFLLLPLGGIVGNTATENGGGIYVSGGEAIFRSEAINGFGSDSDAVIISGNLAKFGAGVWVGNQGRVSLRGAVMNGNTASQEGGAIFATGTSVVDMSAYNSTTPCAPAVTEGLVVKQPPCSRLSNNEAGMYGGAIRAVGGAQVDVALSHIVGNEAGLGYAHWSGSVVAVNYETETTQLTSTVTIDTSVVTGNEGTALSLIGNNGRLEYRWSTLAKNGFGTAARVYGMPGVASEVRFTGSIIAHHHTNATVYRTGSATIALARCVIGYQSAADAGFTTATAYQQSNPLFIDPASSDFRLAPTSPAIDYCHGDYRINALPDLAGNPRGNYWTFAIPGSNPRLGPYDLGAYAAIITDIIFKNGFE